jgi:isocitrate/isopropylmalate dehydrogenase
MPFPSYWRRQQGGRGRVTCVDKANLFASMAFFRKMFDEPARRFPGRETDHIAGTDPANPTAMLLPAALMLASPSHRTQALHPIEQAAPPSVLARALVGQSRRHGGSLPPQPAYHDVIRARRVPAVKRFAGG